MIDAHEFDNDDARKTLVFNSLKLGKVEKSRETDRVAGQRPCARHWPEAVRPSRVKDDSWPEAVPSRYRGANYVLAAFSRQGSSLSVSPKHADAALVSNQLTTRLVRDVQDAFACGSITGSQRIELCLEIAMLKFNFEPVEEQCQESIICLTSEQMPEGLPIGRSNSKRLLFHVLKE